MRETWDNPSGRAASRNVNRHLFVLAILVTCFSVTHTPFAAVFITNAPMLRTRYGHTATLLPDGRVLTTAGYSTGPYYGYQDTAELFSPSTGTWVSTAALPAAANPYNGRWQHTSTLLTNGLVLVSGGADQASLFLQAALYNPSTETWVVTGSLNTGRALHTATLLTNGLVLVAGGYGCCSTTNFALASAELYNPATGTWTNTGNMTKKRKEHTATLLPNGKVLVAGGVDENQSGLSSAELYNPITGTWTA